MQKMEWFGAVMRHSRSQEMPPFDRVLLTSYSTLTETVSVFYRFRDIASFLSKVADFDPPQLHLVPQICVILHLAILVEL